MRLAKGWQNELSAGFEKNAVDMKKRYTDMAQVSKDLSNGMAGGFRTAFNSIASGSKNASDALSDAMGGAVADIAGNYGQMMVSAGLFPPDPPVLAGGFALLALSAALGKGKGSSTVSSGGGGGGMASSTITSPAPNVPQAEKGKSVSLQIMGNYFETQETQKQIMEMIRKESDATDFKYAQIGVR